jgi:YD repeat-containing protein
MGKTATRCLTLLAVSWCLLASHALGDSATYYYDDLGRLARVVKGTQGTIYRYDELGNLLSVSSATTVGAPPVISTINPNVLFVGSTLYVRILGQNLLATESVTTDNPALTISNIYVTDTEIIAEMTAGSAGSAAMTVTTAFGSADIGVTLTDSKLTLSPGQLAIVPSASGTLSASIGPPLAFPLTINLVSSNAAVANVPQTATIPAGGSTDITVNGLLEGVTAISAGETRSVVFVSPPFAGDVSGLAGGRVSVYIEDTANDLATGQATPVSVIVDSPVTALSTGTSAPVSVVVEAPAFSQSTSTSTSVSVYLEDMTDELSTMPSLPVSVQIQ